MVTWHQLICVIGIVSGLSLSGFGALNVFAHGMSDSPADNENPGCMWPLAGLAVLVLSIAGLWL